MNTPNGKNPEQSSASFPIGVTVGDCHLPARALIAIAAAIAALIIG